METVFSRMSIIFNASSSLLTGTNLCRHAFNSNAMSVSLDVSAASITLIPSMADGVSAEIVRDPMGFRFECRFKPCSRPSQLDG